MQQLPGLNNFMKSHQIFSLQPIKFDIYRLTRKAAGGWSNRIEDKLILKYKIKKTKYEVHSCKMTKIGKGRPTFEDGYVKVTKGFESRVFSPSQIPSGIANSIAKHMDRYNQLAKELGEKLVNKTKARLDKKQETDREKRERFLTNLDT